MNNTPAQKPAGCTEFDNVNGTFSLANDLSSQIENLADRLLGCAPRATGLVECGESPDGVLPRMALSAQYTRGRLNEAMNAVDRILKALP